MSEGISSDYGAQMTMVEDLRGALVNIMRDAFPMVPHKIAIAEPPAAPQLGIVVLLTREFSRHELPDEMEQVLCRVMHGVNRSMAETFPSIPMTVARLKPPTAAAHGFVAYVSKTAPKPHYPLFVRARAVLRPTDRMRRLMGLPLKGAQV